MGNRRRQEASNHENDTRKVPSSTSSRSRSRIGSLSTIIFGLVAVLLAWRLTVSSSPAEYPPLVRGKDNTILFLSFAESGQINVQLATIQALSQAYPDMDVHVASFPTAVDKVGRVAESIRVKTPSAKELTFHELPGLDRLVAVHEKLGCGNSTVDECLSHPSGVKGASIVGKQAESVFWSWDGENHLAIYQRVIELVEQIDPAVIVIDALFRPCIDAVRHLNRLHVMMSPNALADLAGPIQPYGAGLWKYPALGTGFSFPVPWHQILQNTYINLVIGYHLFYAPLSGETLSFLRQNGVKPIDVLDFHPHVPIISQSLPGASLPVEVLPTNMSAVGAMLVESADAVSQNAELVEWLRKPTVVVNLGTLFKYDEERARTMASAIRDFVEQSDVQVLWKMAPHNDFGDSYALPLKSAIEKKQVIISKWLPIDTVTLLQAGNIVASIHHGGSSSYNEAVVAGVPQVIIPLWEDHYNFAQLAEDLGIGIYACRRTAPQWDIADLVDSFVEVVDGSEASLRRREKARRIGETASSKPGQQVAAEMIAKLAISSHA